MLIIKFRSISEYKELLKKLKKMHKFTKEIMTCVEDGMEEDYDEDEDFRYDEDYDDDEMNPNIHRRSGSSSGSGYQRRRRRGM